MTFLSILLFFCADLAISKKKKLYLKVLFANFKPMICKGMNVRMTRDLLNEDRRRDGDNGIVN